MKIHIITIGKPKLAYAQAGWEEYWQRLKHYHDVRATHIADKHNDARYILEAAGASFKVALAISGKQFSSLQLAEYLNKLSLNAKELCFIIGGPEGLPQDVLNAVDYEWSLGELTLPHDLAMVLLLETLYRASTINAGQPYHK